MGAQQRRRGNIAPQRTRNFAERFREIGIVPVCVLMLFFSAACLVIWPIPLRLQSALPTGDSPVGTVPMLNAWTIWWNGDRLSHLWQGYWQAPIFFPARYTFGLSEPQPLTAALAPLAWGFGVVAAYNAYLLGTLILNGVVAFRFLRALNCSTLWAATGGLAILLHPLGLHNLEAVQLLALWPVIWFLHSAYSFHHQPTLSSASAMAIAFSASCYTCLYHSLTLAMCMLPAGWFILPWKSMPTQWKRILPGLLWCIALCAALCAPVFFGVWHAAIEHHVSRNPGVITALSAQWRDWSTTPVGAWSAAVWNAQGEFPLNPGWIRLLLATVGGIWLLRSTHHVVARFLIALLITSFLLSFGMHLGPAGQWWEHLNRFIVPLQWMRSPYRFAYLTQLLLLILACLGAQGLSRWLSNGFGSSWGRICHPVVLASLAIALSFEIVPQRSYLTYPPVPRSGQTWTDALVRLSSPSDAIACLPVSPDSSEAGLEVETRWMMYQTHHHRAMVNGYSGYIPKSWSELRDDLRTAPFSQSTLDKLRDLKVRWIVVRLRGPSGTVKVPAEMNSRMVYQDQQFAIIDVGSRTD